jgi:branched-chain amino acid transport system ATP-binding protein
MFLQLDKLSKSFDGLQVLQDISFTLQEGEILGLIGPNGAGKSTIFNVVTGVYRPNSGNVSFQGKSIVGLAPHRIRRKGIARTFQLVRISNSLTVFQNVFLGAIYGRKGGAKSAVADANECLELLNLIPLKDTVSANLTYADRKLVEIARTLAGQPSVTLLDEPLAGLNPTETEKMMSIIREIRETRGLSILWIEHKMDAVFNLCDRIVVLDYGIKIAEGVPNEIATDKKVIEAYLGEPVT